MAAPIVWTESRDQILCELRAEARSWDAIAALLGISRWAAIERGRLVGACKPEPAPPRLMTAAQVTDAQAAEAGREALAPGHPVSWGAITAGTLLDGMPYPFAALAEPAPAAHVVEWAA